MLYNPTHTLCFTLISEMAGWTCDICFFKFPEDGNSGAETHRGDTYHELCFMICNLLCVFVGQCIEFLCNCYDAWLSWQTTFSNYTTFPSVYDAAGSTQQEPSFSDSVPYQKIWCHSRTLNWGIACQTQAKRSAGLQFQAFQVDKWLSNTTVLFYTYRNCL